MLRQKLITFFNRVRRKPEYPHPSELVIEPDVRAAVTREPNGDLILTWQRPSQQVRIFTSYDPEQFDEGTPTAEVQAANTATISGLDLNQRPYFKLVFDDGESLTVAERILHVNGGVNMRDVGGYVTADGRHVRWGQVYRSGDFSRLKKSGRRYLQSLGINLVCDLRTTQELEALANKLPDDIDYLHHPIYERRRRSRGYWIKTVLFNRASLDSFWLNDVYIKRFVDGGATQFGSVLRLIAEADNRPMVVHCTAGKDRTGITVALLLSILGIQREIIIADYTLSNRFYDQLLHAVQSDEERLGYYGIQAADIFPVLTAQAHVLEAAFAHIEKKYGSVEGYLTTAAGLDAAVLESLRRDLLV